MLEEEDIEIVIIQEEPEPVEPTPVGTETATPEEVVTIEKGG